MGIKVLGNIFLGPKAVYGIDESVAGFNTGYCSPRLQAAAFG